MATKKIITGKIRLTKSQWQKLQDGKTLLVWMGGLNYMGEKLYLEIKPPAQA